MRVTLVHPAGFNFVPGQPDLTTLANRMAPIGNMAEIRSDNARAMTPSKGYALKLRQQKVTAAAVAAAERQPGGA